MDKLFKIKRVAVEEPNWVYCAEIDRAHPVFAGHFPQQPVVPGVATLNMVKHCLADALGDSVAYHYIKECKFLSAIIPSEHAMLEVKITNKQNEEPISIVAEVVSNGVTMMKLKATVRKQQEE